MNRRGTLQRAKWGLLLLLGVLPLLGSVGTATVAFHRAARVDFCASCHVMTPFVRDLRNPKSEGLAAHHAQRGWIKEDACYTCHTDYNFLGPVQAKLKGLKHLVAYYRGEQKPPKLYSPYKNGNCLTCHAGKQRYLENEGHADLIDDLSREKTSCLECHDTIHQVEEAGGTATSEQAQPEHEEQGEKE